MNAVLVKGDAVGATLYYGAGAGDEATASAVIADIIDVTRTLTTDPENRVPHLAFQPDELSDIPVLPMNEVETAFYIRLSAKNKAGVLAEVTRILGDKNISITAFIQKETKQENNDNTDIILLTDRVNEGDMDIALQQIAELDVINGEPTRIRVESLG
jgi:homoserine dehydrogenase